MLKAKDERKGLNDKHVYVFLSPIVIDWIYNV